MQGRRGKGNGKGFLGISNAGKGDNIRFCGDFHLDGRVIMCKDFPLTISSIHYRDL